VTLIAGATACLSQEFHNPFDAAKRDQYIDGWTSGDPGRVAGTTLQAVGQVGGYIFNPSKLASEVVGFKP